MLLGAIDIGSNAMRFLVGTATESDGVWQFERVEYLRYPIRLGEDVFTKRNISELKIGKLIKMLAAFKAMFEVFEVEAFHACATSAMRDAENGSSIVKLVKQELGFEIEILDGAMEALLTENVIQSYLDNGNYIHIDVGGGSTEVNIIANHHKLASHSFNIGTVREMYNGIASSDWFELEKWIVNHKIPNLRGVGTGGNIKKLHELSGSKADGAMPVADLDNLMQKMKELPIEERMHIYKLNQDRAEVIVSAATIFSKALNWAQASRIYAPNIGLADGIIVHLWERIKKAI